MKSEAASPPTEAYENLQESLRTDGGSEVTHSVAGPNRRAILGVRVQSRTFAGSVIGAQARQLTVRRFTRMIEC